MRVRKDETEGYDCDQRDHDFELVSPNPLLELVDVILYSQIVKAIMFRCKRLNLA